MSLRSLFSTYFWPVLAGLLGAALLATLLPNQVGNDNPAQLSESATEPSMTESFTGPVSYSGAVRRAAPSVVSIYTSAPLPPQDNPMLNDPFLRRFFNSNASQDEQRDFRSGAGIAISSSGHILTNEHLVLNADQIEVVTQDGRQATAELVGLDGETDLAVIRVDLENLPPIQIGDPDSVEVGDVVLAIGNPFGQGQTVTQGIVSATGRNLLNLTQFVNFLQTDAAINEGNSGGALIDVYGSLIGINTASANVSGAEGVSFAIPADIALSVVEDLVTKGRVVRGWIGIQASELTSEALDSLDLTLNRAMLVTGIDNRGPASAAGILPGDIITGINDQPLVHWQQVQQVISGTSPGEILTLDIYRDSNRMSVRVRAGTRPEA